VHPTGPLKQTPFVCFMVNQGAAADLVEARDKVDALTQINSSLASKLLSCVNLEEETQLLTDKAAALARCGSTPISFPLSYESLLPFICPLAALEGDVIVRSTWPPTVLFMGV
jgi:hypothetical protein